jgi:hypothetical protein
LAFLAVEWPAAAALVAFLCFLVEALTADLTDCTCWLTSLTFRITESRPADSSNGREPSIWH